MGCGGSRPKSSQSNEAPCVPPPKLEEIIQTEEKTPMRNENNIINTRVEITVETLQRFLELEKQLLSYEKRHVIECYQIKSEQLEEIEKAIQQLEEKKQQHEEETEKLQSLLENEQKKSLKQLLIERDQNPEIQLSPEEEELIEALNVQEMTKRELETTIEQRDQFKSEVIELGQECENLQELSQKRDEFLDSIFGGSYGSDTENRLEKEVELLQERKRHVDQAYFKWRQAHTMIKQGCAQLGYAFKKWKQLPKMDESDNEQLYYVVAETRNNLLAAIQNIQGSQRCLPSVKFPYCAPEEIDTLNKAITYIFTDMQTPERHRHACDCYEITYRRAGALSQWFEQVLNTTISRDLAEVSEECKGKAVELRRERVNLIRMKVKEITGRDIDLDTDSAIDSEADDVVADEQVAQIFEADRVGGKRGGRLLVPETSLSSLPTPLPVSDLAPMPSNEEIFGKIDQLRKRHAAELVEFEKAQTVNKARMVQGLQEKLQARRNRRSRLQMHERELAAIQSR